MARSSQHPQDEARDDLYRDRPGEEREWVEGYGRRDYQTLRALGYDCLPDEVVVSLPGGRVGRVVPVEDIEDEAA